jgi:hypothetical protein
MTFPRSSFVTTAISNFAGLGAAASIDFPQNLGCKNESILKSAVLLIVSLECRISINTSLASCMSLPRAIVARGIRAVKLEAANCIITSVHERNAEGSAASELCVNVLVVAEVLHKFFLVLGLLV